MWINLTLVDGKPIYLPIEQALSIQPSTQDGKDCTHVCMAPGIWANVQETPDEIFNRLKIAVA